MYAIRHVFWVPNILIMLLRPGPAGELTADLRGPTFKERKGEGEKVRRGEGKGGKRKEKKGKRRKREGQEEKEG